VDCKKQKRGAPFELLYLVLILLDRMKIKHLPDVLALHLKRFKWQEDQQTFTKLSYRVVFPFELRLFNTVDGSSESDQLYTLWAIVVHIGACVHFQALQDGR
jgi:ubiquitin C-terminal hydrolase